MESVTRAGTRSRLRRSSMRRSGRYVSVNASNSQRSSRKLSCSGWRTNGRCAWSTSARYRSAKGGPPAGVGDRLVREEMFDRDPVERGAAAGARQRPPPPLAIA